MKNAVILHGKPKRERYFNPELPKPHEANWLPWVADRLEQAGVETVIPALPQPYDPIYEDCISEALKFPVDRNTLAIGHSMGAGLWVRYLSEHPDVEVGQLILVAPWLDPQRKYGELFNFTIDHDLTKRCIGGLAIFYSSLDDDNVQQSMQMLTEAFPSARVTDIPRYGHFMLGNTMESLEFPELLQVVRTSGPQ